MARPQRCRRICLEPAYDQFVPTGISGGKPICLGVDEYEAIRLIDFEKKTHAECAAQMEVSRTTVTEIYESARFKLACCLVRGQPLQISGGNYRLCGGAVTHCCGKVCMRSEALPCAPVKRKEANEMRIAVTFENGTIFQHFGHTQQFKLYDVQDGKVTGSQLVSPTEGGHGALAGFLTSHQVDALICGGIGGGAQAALREAGIQLYGGVSGSADAAIDALLSGSLAYQTDVRCAGHSHDHSCHHEGGHCGEDKHGCAGNGCGSH